MSSAIYVAALLLFILLGILVSTTVMHASRTGLQNNAAAFQGFWFLAAVTASAAMSEGLRVDADHVWTDANWCWFGHDDMALLLKQRDSRSRIRIGVGIVMGIEVAW